MSPTRPYLVVALVLAVTYLWVGTRPRVPRWLQRTPDWAGHAAAYAVLGGTLARGLASVPAAVPVASATAHGALLELLQRQVPGRAAELSDVVADAIGSLLGVWVGRRRW